MAFLTPRNQRTGLQLEMTSFITDSGKRHWCGICRAIKILLKNNPNTAKNSTDMYMDVIGEVLFFTFGGVHFCPTNPRRNDYLRGMYCLLKYYEAGGERINLGRGGRRKNED